MNIEEQLAKAECERDEARANYQWMVNRACDEKLEGYRELAAKCAQLEEERDEARAEVATLADALDDIRHQRDRYHVELKQERAEVERMKREVSDARIALKAQEHRDQWLMAQSVGYGFYKRGAEAMREACIGTACAQDLDLDAQDRMEEQLRALPIPEET